MQSYYESSSDVLQHVRAWYDKTNNCMPHFHAGIEVVYVLEGSFTATINGQEITVSTGQLLVNNCYDVHAYSCSASCYSIVACIPLSIVTSIQKLLTSNRFRTRLITDDERSTLEFMMRTLVDNIDNYIVQKGICYALLGYLAGKIPLDPVGTSDQADIICKILNYLNDNFTQHLTVEQVASYFGYSRSRFSHLFKTTVGYSLPQYLNLLRCRRVCQQLLTTDTPVVSLAYNSGFNNAHTFYSAFKSYYHMTPREYIRMHKGGELTESPS